MFNDLRYSVCAEINLTISNRGHHYSGNTLLLSLVGDGHLAREVPDLPSLFLRQDAEMFGAGQQALENAALMDGKS